MPKENGSTRLTPSQPLSHPVASWTSREAYLLALVCLFAGFALGYLFRGSATPVATTVGAAMPAANAPVGQTAPLSAQALQPLASPLLAALKTAPNNADILVQLGNLYYDHQAYREAIEYYGRALALRPNDVNVRTDMGTAYWYSGFPERAVAEYEKSLAVDPTHANTLFNLGVVRLDGLKRPAAAIAAWEKLLKTNPQYPNTQRVLEQIARARSQKQ